MKALKIPQATKEGFILCPEGGVFDISYPSSKVRRGRVQGGGFLIPSLTAAGSELLIFIEKIMENVPETPRPQGKGWCYDKENKKWFRIRKLTPRECFRLMDVKESDIDKLMATQINKKGVEEQIISNSQLYKCAGNSIVVNPMFLCFKNLFMAEKVEASIGDQLSLF